MVRQRTRRHLLWATGVTGSFVFLAGCPSGGDEGSPTETSGTDTSTDGDDDDSESDGGLPTVEGPIPRAEDSVPYVPEVVEDGYTDEEFFVAGEALGESYRTQFNVLEPTNPGEASGVVIVEPTHEAGFWAVRSTAREYVTRAGHAMVAISSSPTVVENILRAHDEDNDQDRYADLAIPDTEGIESAVLGQLGALLRTGGVPGLAADYQVLAGFSNTGAKTRTYIRQQHDEARIDGSPVYDGYMPGQTAVGTFPEAIPDLEVPVVELQGEREVITTLERNPDGLTYRREDGENYRLYEVPGLPHIDTRVEDPTFPPPAVRQSCSPVLPDVEGANADDLVVSDFPLSHEWHLALDHLVRWVQTGTAPPRADRIQLDGDDRVVRDEHGNAVGGKPHPYVEVPVATYTSHSAYDVPEDETPIRCDMVGHRIPFGEDKLERLYGDETGYVDAFTERLDELVDQGWYLERDAAELRSEARDRALF